MIGKSVILLTINNLQLQVVRQIRRYTITNQSTLFAPIAIYDCMYTLHLSIIMEQELSTNPYGLYKESTCYKITIVSGLSTTFEVAGKNF